MSLSDKKMPFSTALGKFDFIQVEDVKEFIRELKKAFPIVCREHHKFHEGIDKLAGKELI